MRKLYWTICLFFPLFASAQEPLNLINPWRETFVNFPSQSVGNTHRVTVFLPEEKVPLQKAYPVVYLLNAGPADKERARAWLDASAQKALVVGLDFTEEDLQNESALVRFFSHELLPYIDTNYYTLARADARVIGASGAAGARLAGKLLAVPGLFGGAALVNPGEESSLQELPVSVRFYLRANAVQVRAWQEDFLARGLAYGTGFAYRLSGEEDSFSNLPLEYLLAPSHEVQPRKAHAAVGDKKLAVPGGSVQLHIQSTLANGMKFDFLPETLRFKPSLLLWDPSAQTLSAPPGARPGTVKISGIVDKIPFKTQIKLKKQEK